MAITIDGPNRRIILDTTTVSAATIWSRWVDWHKNNQNWPLAFSQVGGDDLGSGLSIPPYYFLQGAWRIRPMETNHNLTITGNLFVEGGGIPVVSTLGTYQVNVNYTVPVQAQGIATSGTTGPSATEIANAVWAAMSRTLTSAGAGGATASEVWEYANRTITTDIPTPEENAAAVWSAPVSTMTDKTTIGGYIKKALLTIPAFLGLK